MKTFIDISCLNYGLTLFLITGSPSIYRIFSIKLEFSIAIYVELNVNISNCVGLSLARFTRSPDLLLYFPHMIISILHYIISYVVIS